MVSRAGTGTGSTSGSAVGSSDSEPITPGVCGKVWFPVCPQDGSCCITGWVPEWAELTLDYDWVQLKPSHTAISGYTARTLAVGGIKAGNLLLYHLADIPFFCFGSEILDLVKDKGR